RANNCTLVHACGELREHFADPDTRHAGVDRLELAADLDGRLGLDVPQVLVGRAAAEEDVDDGLLARGGGAGARLGAGRVGKGERARAHAEGADAEEAAAGDAVAQARPGAEKRQHGGTSPFRWEAGVGRGRPGEGRPETARGAAQSVTQMKKG